MARFLPIGYAMPTPVMPWIGGRRSIWCRPPWAMPALPPQAAISTPGQRIAQPVTWEFDGRGLIASNSYLSTAVDLYTPCEIPPGARTAEIKGDTKTPPLPSPQSPLLGLLRGSFSGDWGLRSGLAWGVRAPGPPRKDFPKDFPFRCARVGASGPFPHDLPG
jgi:hypothetical protein